jgi:hypothetical protein
MILYGEGDETLRTFNGQPFSSIATCSACATRQACPAPVTDREG